MPTLEYTISVWFPNGLNPRRLENELRDNTAIAVAMGPPRTVGDKLYLDYYADLDQDSKEELDGSQDPAAATVRNPNSALGRHIATLDPSPSKVELTGLQVDADGILQTHPSPRRPDWSTYFTSVADRPPGTNGPEDIGEIGAGDVGDDKRLIFNMAASDPFKTKDLVFVDPVEIKDGWVGCQGAPLGAMVSAEGFLPDGLTKVSAFVCKAALLDTMPVPFDTEDKGLMPAGFILRLTVYNADGDGEADPAAAFKVVARAEVYRERTVVFPPPPEDP